MFQRLFKKGDWVVYRRLKVTTSPGPRAQKVDASAHGDDYMYFVDKFWIVADVRADHKLLLKTRRGKTHLVGDDDPNLRNASLWERIRYRARFLELQNPVAET